MINTNNDIQALPKDWKLVKLGEVCTKISLNKIKIKQKDYLSEGEFPVVDQGQELIGGYYNEKSLVLPGEPPFIVFGDHTKVKKYINFKFIAGADGVKVLKAKEIIDSKFLFYSLLTIKIEDKGYARHFQLLEKEPFPLPPKPTQLAIVSKIEELFSELDKGIEQLKTAQQQLKTYRQSVLKWAFEGKLTNKNVKEGALPEGWKWVKLGDVIEKPKYGTSKKCDYETKGIGVLRIPNIVKGVVDSSDLKFAKFDKKEIETYSLKEGDILTIRSNGSVDIVGKCAMITRKDEGFLYAGYLIRLRPLQKLVLPKYLINILTSINLRNQIELKAKSTSGVNNINSEELAGLSISLPPLKEQNQIVQEIESRLSVADKMEESITQSLQQAEALRQSILKQAFEGKLI
jgi:type I restriction enzyme, S subunit